MDKITLKNIMFYGYHGMQSYERQYGQRFYFDIQLLLNLELAGQFDDLTQTVDYTKVYDIAKDIVENEQYNLLEALAEKIAKKILLFDAVQQVKVKVRKPSVPVNGQIDYMEIEITRSKNDIENLIIMGNR